MATGGVIVIRGLGPGLASVTTFLGVRIDLGAIGVFVIMLGAALGIVVFGLGPHLHFTDVNIKRLYVQ
ncbi:hypothetical protein [Rickettsia endosymbiont of Cantharis rufa]|uniref:hypothetical protein n=1 Tax=Rickettsia endosymbiont of Cantharis rufa TaxID=3066248 RepID=UPI003133205B